MENGKQPTVTSYPCPECRDGNGELFDDYPRRFAWGEPICPCEEGYRSDCQECHATGELLREHRGRHLCPDCFEQAECDAACETQRLQKINLAEWIDRELVRLRFRS